MFPFANRNPHPDDPSADPDQPADGTGTSEPPQQVESSPQVGDPLRRQDLSSPGVRGLIERVLLGSASMGRVMGLFAAIVAVTAAVYVGYRHFVGFAEDGDFFNPGLALMVFGSHLAQSFLPRTASAQPHTGYTVVNATQTAAVSYVAFVLVTEPLDGSAMMRLLSYGAFALVSMLVGLITTTRMRRAAQVLAEQQAAKGDQDALRRALHMDR